MKKFSQFLYKVFFTNVGIKLLSIVLAAFVVFAINVPNEVEHESNYNTEYTVTD